MTAPELMALFGIVICPTSVLILVTRAVSSVIFPGILLTITESPTLNLCVKKTKAPARIPPTKVEMIKPMVMEAKPAPVMRVWGETLRTLRTANNITRIAMEPMKYCSMVLVCSPKCLAMSGFERFMNMSMVSQKPTIRAISMAWFASSERLMGSSMKVLIKKNAPAAKAARSKSPMMNLFTELTMLGKLGSLFFYGMFCYLAFLGFFMRQRERAVVSGLGERPKGLGSCQRNVVYRKIEKHLHPNRADSNPNGDAPK